MGVREIHLHRYWKRLTEKGCDSLLMIYLETSGDVVTWPASGDFDGGGEDVLPNVSDRVAKHLETISATTERVSRER